MYRILEAADDMFNYMRREPEFPGRAAEAPEIAMLLNEARELYGMFQTGTQAKHA
jgi:hypothetical protein